jgi:penicillin-binding protein-related factor A (putative recombinase)|tara:strand:+ start:27 stop:419 length:393 start_codon:yes stop_codon:yes gene_type:complete
MAKEKNLWLLVRDNLKDFHLQRIETGMTGSGVPDVNGCYAGVEFWLELKDVSTNSNKIGLRVMQVSWIARRVAHGGKVFVLARKLNKLYLYKIQVKDDIIELVDNGLTCPPDLLLEIPYEWSALGRALLS